MQNYSQLDQRWAHMTIGNTKFTLGKLGCTITSLCMLLSKFHPESNLIPPEAAKKWAFNSNAEIIWTLCNFDGMRFLKRGYGNNAEIKLYASEPKKGVIIQVNNSHWIAAEGIEGGKLIVHDPIDGKRYVEVPSRYNITGYALFESIDSKIEVSDYAKEAVEKLTKEGYATDWSDPKRTVVSPEGELMLMRAGVLKRKEPQGGVSKEDLAVVIVAIKNL